STSCYLAMLPVAGDGTTNCCLRKRVSVCVLQGDHEARSSHVDLNLRSTSLRPIHQILDRQRRSNYSSDLLLHGFPNRLLLECSRSRLGLQGTYGVSL